MCYILLSIFLCLTIFTVSTFQAPLRDDESPDIEDFIDRLLASDKFDKLADKIAEKAADKIITLQYSRDEKHVDRAQEVKVEPHKEEADKEESKEEKKVSADLHKEESLESKEKAQIDTIAAIHKFEELSSEPLSLNFKHFKTTVTTTSRKINPTTVKLATKSSKKPDNTVQRVTMLHRARAQESDRNSKSGSNSSEDNAPKPTQEDTLEKTMESLEKAKISEKTDDNSDSNEKTESESIETTTMKVKKAVRKEKAKKSKTKETEAPKSVTETSESEAEVTVKPKPKSNENKDGEKTDDNKIVNEEKGTTDNDEEGTTRKDYRHMIRQESGKYYAFQQSPDYDEYHDKLAKLLNTVHTKNKRRSG